MKFATFFEDSRAQKIFGISKKKTLKSLRIFGATELINNFLCMSGKFATPTGQKEVLKETVSVYQL